MGRSSVARALITSDGLPDDGPRRSKPGSALTAERLRRPWECGPSDARIYSQSVLVVLDTRGRGRLSSQKVDFLGFVLVGRFASPERAPAAGPSREKMERGRPLACGAEVSARHKGLYLGRQGTMNSGRAIGARWHL